VRTVFSGILLGSQSNSKTKRRDLFQLFAISFLVLLLSSLFIFGTVFWARGSTFNGQPVAGSVTRDSEGAVDVSASSEEVNCESAELSAHLADLLASNRFVVANAEDEAFLSGEATVTVDTGTEGVVSADQVAMSLEEGVAHLSASGFGVIDASAGGSHSLAVLSDGTLWAWGNGQWGRLGVGEDDTRFRTVPTRVGTGTNWESVAAGHMHSLAIQSDGTLWAWGNNASGALGLGIPGGSAGLLFATVPTQVAGTNWERATAGEQSSLAIRSDGTLWSWGWGGRGLLGHGYSNQLNPLFAPSLDEPTQIGTDADWSHVSVSTRGHSMSSPAVLALKDDGTLWGWGAGAPVNIPPHNSNRSGSWYLGFPNQVGSDTWKSISTGYGTGRTHAIRSDGTWWDLRFNFTQQQYDNRQIGTSNDWKAVSLGAHFAIALKNDGTLWQRGGMAGSPAIGTPYGQVGADDDWAFIARESGDDHTLAVRDDGTLWGFGHNFFGQLGQRNSTGAMHSSPVFIMPEILEVDEVAPIGEGVPVNTGYIRVMFNTAVNTETGIGTVTLQGVELDPSTFIWSEADWHLADTVLLIPIPDLPMPYDTLHTVVISGFMSATGGTMLEDYTHTFTTGPEIGLTKTLQTPVGTALPTNASFVFEFERVQASLCEFTYSRPVAHMPVINNQTVTIDSSTTTTTAGVTTATGTLNLGNLMHNLEFPIFNGSRAGVFVWNLTEQADSSNTAYPSSMSYDDTRFQIRAVVDFEGDVEQVDVYSFVYNPHESEWVIGPKLDSGPSFTNTYIRYTSDIDNNHLEITKDVEGEFAETDTLFDFALAFSLNDLAPIDFPLTATIIGADGNPVEGTRNPVIIAAGSGTFQLAHDERLVLPALPLGTTFEVSELAHAEFAPEVEVIMGGQSVHTGSGSVYTTLSTGLHVLSSGGRNAADFTNVHQFTPSTGLTVSSGVNALVVLGVLAVMVPAMLFAANAYSRRGSRGLLSAFGGNASVTATAVDGSFADFLVKSVQLGDQMYRSTHKSLTEAKKAFRAVLLKVMK